MIILHRFLITDQVHLYLTSAVELRIEGYKDLKWCITLKAGIAQKNPYYKYVASSFITAGLWTV